MSNTRSPIPTAARIAAAVTAHGNHPPRRDRDAGVDVGASWEDSGLPLQLSPQSRMVCQRSSGRFSRQVNTTRLEQTRKECRRTRDRFRNILQDRADQARLARPLERAAAGEHFVEHGAENAKMSVAGVGLMPSICSGAMYWSVPRIVPVLRSAAGWSASNRRAVRLDAAASQLREAEVEQLRAGPRQHDVRRLRGRGGRCPARWALSRASAISMAMRQRVARAESGALRLPSVRRERLAIEVLHDEKVGAVVLADVMERADVRM